MKLFLDDTRPPPKGWRLVKSAYDMITLLKTRTDVDEISLDHDLGDESLYGTGYTVLKWIEEAVVTLGYKPPIIRIHTSNPVGGKRMLQTMESINRFNERLYK